MENELKKQIEIIKKFIDNDLLRLEIHDTVFQKNEAVKNQDFGLAADLREQ